jgi:hypothetical protein
MEKMIPLRRILAACLLLAALTSAQEVRPTEYQVKAQYLSDFGRFVRKWGNRSAASADEPFSICVLGQDPFGAALDAAVRGEAINGSQMTAKRIVHPQDASTCRILYIGSSEQSQMRAILAAVGTAPVLTVADTPDFLKEGGVIRFVLDGDNVKLEISLASADRAGLVLSSQLLKVARIVRKAP